MSREEARKLVRGLFLKTLPHLQVGPKMRRMVHLREGVLNVAGDTIPLHDRRPVRVIAMGKAAIEMTHTLAEIMHGVRLRGVVAAPEDPRVPVRGFEYYKGGHPYPNDQSRRAAEAALALLDQRNVTADDLVLFLISGGGSSLFEMPLDPRISREDVSEFYRMLVTSGASIEEINTIRKHMSEVKGGRLAKAAWPARQVTLYVSDVPENSPEMIASGPTLPDETMVWDCDTIIKKYHLLERMPASYRAAWDMARLEENPRPDDPCFSENRYYCLLSNWNAVEKMAELAENAGIIVETDSRCDDWKLEDAAAYLLECLAELRQENPGKTVAVVSGGELRCPVTGDGMGGRNQAFVLDCVEKIASQPVVVLSAGTDGVDGNSPAAGAIADGETAARSAALPLDPAEYMRRSDSFHFFEKLGDTITTGPTGTNVRDLRLLVAYPE